MLEIKLFGRPDAHCFGRPIVGFASHQPCLLLCYLVLYRDQPHPREQVAAVFWLDYPHQVARKHLRNALWRLRHLFDAIGASLDQYLLCDDDALTFVTASDYRLDVELFEANCDACRQIPGEHLTSDQAALLDQAVLLYTGDLLEGVHDEWFLAERERLFLLYLDALGKLMAHAGATGDYSRGLDYGRRILVADNTREQVHRSMMRLHWLAGNRCGALAQYRQCTQILRDEIGVAPMRRTQALYEQIVHCPADPEDWQSARFLSPSTGLRCPPNQPLTEFLLQRVESLRGMVEEANAELQQIEQLLLESRSPDDPPG